MDEDVRDQLLRRLAPLPVIGRRLFGGFGLYLEGRYFGVISGGRVYFRTDHESRPEYERRGMRALQPRHRPAGPKNRELNFEVPPEIMKDGESLRAWARRAAAAKR